MIDEIQLCINNWKTTLGQSDSIPDHDKSFGKQHLTAIIGLDNLAFNIFLLCLAQIQLKRFVCRKSQGFS
jgi:hypothetical protein